MQLEEGGFIHSRWYVGMRDPAGEGGRQPRYEYEIDTPFQSLILSVFLAGRDMRYYLLCLEFLESGGCRARRPIKGRSSGRLALFACGDPSRLSLAQ